MAGNLTAHSTSVAPPLPHDHAGRILADASRARFIAWGLRDYADVLSRQEALHAARAADAVPDCWLAGEHPDVVTLGVRGAESDLLLSGRYPVFRVNRGGQATLHNPGQLVIYPIVKTQGGLLAQAWLSRWLLSSVRDWLLLISGVPLELEKGKPGLFFAGRKVAAIGISVHKRVAMHGIAINLCNDISPWQAIIPCGEPGRRPLTLSDAAGRRIEPRELIQRLPHWLATHWAYECVDQESW